MLSVFAREFKSYFRGAIGYLFCAFVLLFAGIFTMSLNLNFGYASFALVLDRMAQIFLFAIPILTMRSLAEEHHQKTDYLLRSLPMGSTRIVLGKYLALLSILAIPTLVMACYPLILSMYGKVHFLSTYYTLLAFFLLGAALIAIGMFLSSLTDHQVIAAVSSLAVFLINNYMVSIANYVPGTPLGSLLAFGTLVLLASVLVGALSRNWTLAGVITLGCAVVLTLLYRFFPTALEGLFPAFLSSISLFARFHIFTEGILDLTATALYVAVAGVFLFLTVQSMDRRR